MKAPAHGKAFILDTLCVFQDSLSVVMALGFVAQHVITVFVMFATRLLALDLA